MTPKSLLRFRVSTLIFLLCIGPCVGPCGGLCVWPAAANAAGISLQVSPDGNTDSGEQRRESTPSEQAHGSLYFTYPRSLSSFQTLPDGFQKKHFDPPSIVGIKLGQHGKGQGLNGTELDLYVGFPGLRYATLFGVAGRIHSGQGAFRFSFGIDYDNQKWINSSVLNESFLDHWRWAAVVRLDVPQPLLHPFVEFKWINIADTQIADYEGLATKVAHESSYLIKPGLKGSLGPILTEASVGVYFLGATAIASKEFAFQIRSQTAYRPELAAGLRFGNLELWMKAARVYSDREDTIEYLYQAPFYHKDNLVTKSTLMTEVRWNF